MKCQIKDLKEKRKDANCFQSAQMHEVVMVASVVTTIAMVIVIVGGDLIFVIVDDEMMNSLMLLVFSRSIKCFAWGY